MAQYLTGEKLGALSARTRTFITERPLPTGPAVSLGGQGGSTMGEVTVDDAAPNRASKTACSYNGCWRRSKKVPPTAPAGPRSVGGSPSSVMTRERNAS
ncbi:MAG TPA: hypothetical protein VMF65_17705 [Acidimicrobiales bacterium]|nr:hypothetical protein [Acidimicrobiales bacterium]